MHTIVSAFILHTGNVFMHESGILKRFNFLKLICISSISLSNNIHSWLFLHTAIKLMVVEGIPTNITRNILFEPCFPSNSMKYLTRLCILKFSRG